MKKLLTIILMLVALPTWAADYYIAQTAAGSGNGASCDNADAIADLTWGTDNMVEAGDTLHLCGTLTSTLTIGASGSDGSPITVKFESGSKFSSSTAWGQDASSAIYATSKNYITIDGADTGIIENTDNGDELGNKDVTTYGVTLLGCSNVTVKDLTIRNMYVHVSGGTASHSYVRAIQVVGGSNITTSGNKISHSGIGINIGSNSGTFSNATVLRNSVSYCNKCFVVGLGSDTAAIDGVDVNGNTCQITPNWYDEANLNHRSGIHVWGRGLDGTAEITNLKIHNNVFYGDTGDHGTSHIYLENCVISPLVYNNALSANITLGGDGFIYVKGNQSSSACSSNNNPQLYNNTIYGFGTGVGIMVSRSVNPIIKNNIVSNVDTGIYDVGEVTGITSDYNNFYLSGSSPMRLNDVSITWAAWQTAGYDAHSITSDPKFVSTSDLSLQSDSPAIDVGTGLSGIFTTDLLGNTRTGTWDMGAYEYGETGGDETPPTVLSATIQTNGTDLVIVFSEQITATDNAAFTVDPSGANVTVDCPAVESATNTMTCVINRTIQYDETATYGYTGTTVEDTSANDLATISNTPSVVNNSTVGDVTTRPHMGCVIIGGSIR